MIKIARTTLATTTQVIQTAGYTDIEDVGGSDIVDEFIEEAEQEVSGEWGDPIKKARFTLLGPTQTKYEFRIDNTKTYKINKVIIRESDNTRREYTAVDSDPTEAAQTYTKDFEFNTITFQQATIAAWDGRVVEVTYVPAAHHHLVRLKAALSCLDKSNVMNAEENMPAQSIRLMSRIKRLEKALTDAAAVGSEDEKYYDPTLGELVIQRRFRIY